MKRYDVSEIYGRMFLCGYGGAISFCREKIESGEKAALFTPNAEMLSAASRSEDIKRLLLGGDILFPDGAGVHLAMKARGRKAVSRTAGIELGEKLLKMAACEGYGVFLLGARAGVAEEAAKRLVAHFPSLRICGVQHGYFRKSGKENAKIIKKINSSGADILFVCLGFPIQEKWIVRNISRLSPVKIAAGLGGSLDVWSGNVDRAPAFLRAVGCEWLFRMATQPKRLSRLPSLADFALNSLFHPRVLTKMLR